MRLSVDIYQSSSYDSYDLTFYFYKAGGGWGGFNVSRVYFIGDYMFKLTAF